MNSDKIRYRIVQIIFFIGAVILLLKAAQLQVFDPSYRDKADRMVLRKSEQLPARGLIYDRNKNLMVYNEPIYELEVIYNDLPEKLDTVLLCQLLGITKAEFKKRIVKDWKDMRFSKFTPFVFMTKIDQEKFLKFEEYLWKFPGFYPRVRSIRSANVSSAAHLLGYISEVNQKVIEDSSGIYGMGDYIGNSGLEGSYESLLRGKKGYKYILRDKLGKALDSYKDGALDIDAVAGHDIITTIDLELQQYAETLLKNKRGAVVAIEPSTGEILAMVSAPYFDPNELSIRENRGEAFLRLLNDTINRPLINRALIARYPPGSIFKPIIGLVALQLGVVNENFSVHCGGAYVYRTKYNVFRFGCHRHPQITDMSIALQHSCNSYFFELTRNLIEMYGYSYPGRGLDTLASYLSDFGLGKHLNIDLANENKGFVPDSRYYDWVYRNQRAEWRSTYIMSIGIGQGEMDLTTLQMANLAAIIANRGYYYTPHSVKKFIPAKNLDKRFTTKNYVRVDKKHFGSVIDGMEKVITSGTARSSYVPDLHICGKTGTSQNVHGDDHSVFFGFAPRNNPKIAIAVYVENAGWGGQVAAPIGSLIMEKYVNKEIKPYRKVLEEVIIKKSFLGPKNKNKKPKNLAEVPTELASEEEIIEQTEGE